MAKAVSESIWHVPPDGKGRRCSPFSPRRSHRRLWPAYEAPFDSTRTLGTFM